MTAQSVTLEQINARITKEEYVARPQGSLLTFCILTLDNGFTVTGESACADPLKFNEEDGKKYARQDAIGKIWPLLGFELKTKLSLIDKAGPVTGEILSLGSPKAYVGTKVIYALPMKKRDYCFLRDWEIPTNEDPLEDGYLVQYADGGKPNLEGFTGYVSWSPKDVFEKAYSAAGEPRKREEEKKDLTNLTFGEALEAVKGGRSVCRLGWNGKNQFIYMIKGSDLQKSLQYGYGEYLGEPEFAGSICLKTTQNKLVVGWAPSQTDMLAEDWMLI